MKRAELRLTLAAARNLSAGGILAAAGALAAAGCAGRERREPALCSMKVGAPVAQAPEERTLHPSTWFRLLVPSFDSSGEVLHPIKDCAGDELPPTTPGCGGDPRERPTPSRKLTGEDLVVSHVRGGWRLVWVLTERFPNGEAAGPIALTDFDGDTVRVEALGALRAYPGQVKLQFARVNGADLLLAEGESCGKSSAGQRCDRVLELVPLVNKRRFVPQPLVSAEGACLGRASIPVRAEGPVPGERGQRYEATSVVTYRPEGVLVREELTIREANSEGGAPSFVGRMHGDRTLTLTPAGRMTASGPAMWDQWMAAKKDRKEGTR